MIDTAIPHPTQTLSHAKYPAYKNSGVDWLGEIPAHWECVRMKWLFSDISIKNKPNAELLSVTQNQGVVPRTWVENRMVMPSGNLESFKFIRKGDFAISLRSFEGGLEYCHHDGIISPAYTVLHSSRTNHASFYKHLFKSQTFISELQTSIVGIREGKNINYEELCYSFLPIPPLSEQTRIAEFLDRKTAQIDQAIAQKEQLIELLNERRQVMIHKAVTRGLNPDVKMKDSGIDRGDARWIGEIPAHWEVKRINWLFNEKDETGYPKLPLLIVSINSGVTVRDMDDNENRKQLAEDFNVYKRTLAGDIAFNKMRMWQGAVGVVPQDGLVSPDYVVARPNHFVNSAFYGFLFKTREYLAEFIKHSHGIAWDRNRLYWDDFKNIFAVVPPLEEQNQIVEFLNAQQKEITFATKLIHNQIQKLQELKSTLINSAVTGKIKV